MSIPTATSAVVNATTNNVNAPGISVNRTYTTMAQYDYLVVPYGSNPSEKWKCRRAAIVGEPAAKFTPAVLACDWPAEQRAAAGPPAKLSPTVVDREMVGVTGICEGGRLSNALWGQDSGLSIIWASIVKFFRFDDRLTPSAGTGTVWHNITELELANSAFVDAGPMLGQSGSGVVNKKGEVVGIVQGRLGQSFGIFTPFTADNQARIKATIVELDKKK